tara:strand:+ start:6444 stop:6878 length:435 start_codon:yes stop_codon:yes gene_type:complete
MQMNNKLNTTLLITLCLLVLASMTTTLIYTFQGRDMHLYIWNQSGDDRNISYFSSHSGHWSEVISLVPAHGLGHAVLHRSRLYSPANFNLAVGNKLHNFYCTANITSGSFHDKIDGLQYKGHCELVKLDKHDVALIIQQPSFKA